MNFSGVSDRGLVGRILRFPLRLLPGSLRMPILQGPLRGKRWVVGSGNHGCWLGSYEHEKQKLFWDAVRVGDVVFDLGANAGFYTLLASLKTGTSGHVYGFEPLPLNLGYLHTHLGINGITNCTIIDAAVGGESGVAIFDAGPSASMGHLTNVASAESFSVRKVAIDDLVMSGELRPPSLVKCDVEGAEYEVLKGARETLRRYHPQLFLATHGAEVHAECCGLLVGLGYALSSLDAAPVAESSELYATYPETAGRDS